MTVRRFYAPAMAFAPDEKSVLLDSDETRHLRDVLRLRSGDEVLVFDGTGREFRCEIESTTKSSSELRVLAETEPACPESPLHLTLAIVLLKHEKFDLVVQKATELGVTRIVPVSSDRADVRPRPDEDAGKRLGRWQRIALEAAKQSGRARVPEIQPTIAIDSLLKSIQGERWMFAEREGKPLSRAEFSEDLQHLTVLIGPEGGFTDEEIELARDAGWKIVTLGGRIMRAETAAIAVTALLQHRFGDLT